MDVGSIDNLSAATIVFGPIINWALYGVLCVQTYVYSYNFPNDKRLLKTLVYFVFLLETAQTALTGVDIYKWFMVLAATGGGLIGSVSNESHFTLIDVPIMDALISLIVQIFFSYRIWTLSKRLWWICIILVLLSLTQATGAAWGGLTGNAHTLLHAISKPGVYIWLITSAVVDILIAIMMTFLLKPGRRRRNNENQCSHFVPVRIVRFIIETNMLTTAVAIVSLALYIGFPKDMFYLLPTTVIGKLYSNTLLVTLNNRIYFRNRLSPKEPSAGFGPSSHPVRPVPQIRPPPRIDISNCTIPLESFSSTTDSDPEKARSSNDYPVLNIRPVSSSWGRKTSCYLRMV